MDDTDRRAAEWLEAQGWPVSWADTEGAARSVARLAVFAIDELREDLRWLRALEAAGVDNWEGCDHAADIMRRMETEGDQS